MPRRDYYQKNKAKLREYGRTYIAEWLKKNPRGEEYNEYMNTYKKQPLPRLKENARNVTRYHIATGKLSRGACEASDCDAVTEAHHDDYAKPLEIKWLCKRHHEELHHGTI